MILAGDRSQRFNFPHVAALLLPFGGQVQHAKFLGLLLHGQDCYDLAAEELRVAIRSLELLIGRVDVENLLDEIFSNFCLGK